VALLTLALGIGANAAMFSIVNGVLLRPLPYPDAQELVLLHESNSHTGELVGRVSFQDLQDWRTRSRSFAAIAGYAFMPTILTGRGDPVEVEMTYVTDQFFDALGARVALGRTFVEEDHRLAKRVAVISDDMWRTKLGGDAHVLGSTILLRGIPYTVTGVMSPDMRHPTPGTSVWVPHSLVEPNMFANGMPQRGDRYLEVVARLAPDVTAERAQRELTSVSHDLARLYPATNEDWNTAAVIPMQTALTGDVQQVLIVVLSVVAFILLIGCANLANLLLARGSARAREIAIRVALGAGRRRIVRQLLTESVVLALMGGILGVALAYVGLHSILALSADTLPRMEDVRIDGTVLTFAMLLAALTGVLFGLVPALRLSQTRPQEDLRGGRGTLGSEGQSLRGLLVVAEVALAVLLVVGAGLMARSFLALRSVDPGFDADRVLTVAMQLNLTGVPDDSIGDFLVRRREEILERVRALPAVEEAGMINVFPLRRDGSFSMEYRPANSASDPNAPFVNADTRYVDPGYLRTMRIPLLQGEQLPVDWPDGAPVPVVLSKGAAERLFPDGDAIGRHIAVPWGESRVAGIVGDVRQIGLDAPPEPAVYFPQSIAPRLVATMVIRSAVDPATLAAPVRRVIKDIDPDQPIRSIEPLTAVLSESIARDRFFTVLFVLFGSLALLLSAVGIYGVLAYSVKQRTQEIGVRMAMGASSVDVLRLVARGGMRLVAAGVAIGAAAALLLGKVLASQLYGISSKDPLTFVASVGFLSVVALLAIYIPARRAMRVPPMIALRPE
jgi:predicted permease